MSSKGHSAGLPCGGGPRYCGEDEPTSSPIAAPWAALPPRLAKVADVALSSVRPGSRPVVADIGTGRGELALSLLGNCQVAQVIASDRSAKAIAILDAMLNDRGLAGQIETRCGDGFSVLRPGEADLIVLAGIGGKLAVELLSRDINRLCGAHGPVLIVQPMSRPELVRAWAYSCDAGVHRYYLRGECLAFDAGRYYHVFALALDQGGSPAVVERAVEAERAAALRAQYSEQVLAEIGYHVLARPDPLLAGYLIWRLRALDNLISQASAADTRAGLARASAARKLADEMHAVLRAVSVASNAQPESTRR